VPHALPISSWIYHVSNIWSKVQSQCFPLRNFLSVRYSLNIRDQYCLVMGLWTLPIIRTVKY
jgi:hypothetical protein